MDTAMPAGTRFAKPRLQSGVEERAFRQEGEIWTIVYESKTIRLKDARGLHYLSLLLHHSGQAIAATTLVKFERRGSDSTPEAARSAVTKRIRDAIHKISEHHPSLGHHLSTCVHTGYQCRYAPNPAESIAWTG